MKGNEVVNMLQRARALLTEPNDYNPHFEENFIAGATKTGREVTRLFVVSDSMKVGRIDVSDIGTNIAAAAKENTAMNDRPIPVADQLRAIFETKKSEAEAGRQSIVNEQFVADNEHASTIARLNDEIASANSIHDDATTDFVARIADADRALEALAAGLKDLDASAPPPAPPQAPIATPAPAK